MFGGKKAKELEEELLALQEKQNRLQEQISNIAKAKDSAEETLVQMTISKTELDETITAVSEELELLKECSEANSGQTVLLKQQLAKKNEQNIRLQQEKEALCQQMEGEHEKIAKVVEKNKYVTTPMKEIESFYEAYCQERESVEEALQKLADISQNMGVLALGAAIEAGRMGEDGRKFVTAAEEVRVNAEQYTSAVADVLARISGFEETATEVEKQIHALNDLLKENNGSLVKLLEDRDTEAVETDHENVEAEMICDGIHIHPATVRQTFKMFGDDRIILISDSMEATGMPDGEYALGGQKVIKTGNLAALEDGTIAGSATNLMDCVRVVVQKMRIPLESAVKCAAVNSAKSVGIYDQYGSITPGKKANLVLLKEEDLSTVQVILRGQKL